MPDRSDDSTALKQMPFLIPPGSKLYTDKRYPNYVIEDLSKSAAGIYLRVQRTSRVIKQYEPYIDYIIFGYGISRTVII